MPLLHTTINRTHVIRINRRETYRVLRLIGALIFTNKVVTNGCVTNKENISLFIEQLQYAAWNQKISRYK